MEKMELEHLKEQAVEKAIEGDFAKAIEVNLRVLKEVPDDVDTLMQLAHAYWQIGNIKSSKLYYKKTLDLDPNNILAKKRINLLRTITDGKQLDVNRKKGKIVPITDLIEEPGKTKTVRLSFIGKPEHISLLTIGEEVFLSIRKRKIEVRDLSGNFIGYLPDDISKRLIEFIQGGSSYQAFIFSIEKNEVKAFVKEVAKAKKYAAVPSFSYEDTLSPAIEEDDDEKPSEEEDMDLDTGEEATLTTPEDHHKGTNAEEDSNDEDEDEDHDYEE